MLPGRKLPKTHFRLTGLKYQWKRNPKKMEWRRDRNTDTYAWVTMNQYMHQVCFSYQSMASPKTFFFSSIHLVVEMQHKLGRVKRICVFEHSVMTNFNCVCPAIQKGPGIRLSVWRFRLTHCLYERAAEVLARLRGCAGSPEHSLLA